MGLLDFFKSSGESRGKELSFAELGCWIIGEQERLGRDVVKQAQPLVKESERLVDGIRVSVKQLDATEIPENMFERAEKIVKTSKPDYVRSMNDAIKGLEYGRTDDFTGLLEFSASLEKTVNALGKIDATRGRYLFFGFEEQQKEIQRKGRKLMETQERLKKLLESDGRIREIGALMQQHNGINGLIAGREAAVKELSDVNARIKEAEGGIKETFSRLKEESSKKEYALLEALKERLSEARVERQNVEDKILRTISPFKKDLMKYRRNVYDAPGENKSMTIDGLIEDTVPTFLNSDATTVKHALEGFKKSVESDEIQVKDKQKTLTRITNALNELDDDLKKKHARIKREENEMESEMKKLCEADAREKLEGELKRERGWKTQLESKLPELQKRIKNLEDEINEGGKTLDEKLTELTSGKVRLTQDIKA